MRRTINQRVDEFISKNLRKQISIADMNEIYESGNTFKIIETAYYLGYMRGIKAKKGGAR